MKANPDRRRFGRRGVCKPATILLPGGTALTATVVNISEGGALLTNVESDAVTGKFQLIIASDDMRVACRVVHRDQRQLGVEFISLPVRASHRSQASDRVAPLVRIKEFLGAG